MKSLLRKPLLALVLLTAPVLPALAAEETGHEAEATHQEPSIWWKWFNFSILAGGLGYLAISKGGPYFRQRGEEIYRLVRAAEQIQAEADSEAAEMDRKMAGLGAEVAKVRTKAKQEFQAEVERTDAEVAAAAVKLQQNVESEIAGLAKQARRELQTIAAERALALVREKVQARMNPELENRLIAGFIKDLKQIGSQTGAQR